MTDDPRWEIDAFRIAFIYKMTHSGVPVIELPVLPSEEAEWVEMCYWNAWGNEAFEAALEFVQWNRSGARFVERN